MATRTIATNVRHGRPQGLPEAIDYYEGVLDDASAAISAVADCTASVNLPVGAFAEAVTALEAAVTGLSDSAVDTAVGAVVTAAGTAVTDVGLVTSYLATVGTAKDLITTKVADVTAARVAAAAAKTALSNYINGWAGTLAQLLEDETYLDLDLDLSGALGDITTAVGTVTSAISALTSDLGTLGTKQGTASDSVAAVGTALAGTVTPLANLDAALTNATDKLALVPSFTTSDEALEALDAAVTAAATQVTGGKTKQPYERVLEE